MTGIKTELQIWQCNSCGAKGTLQDVNAVPPHCPICKSTNIVSAERLKFYNTSTAGT